MGYFDTFDEERRRKARKLIDLEIDEVSIVDRAASGFRFSIVKRALPKEIGDFLGDEADLEKDLEGAQAAVLKAVELLAKYKEDFPDDILRAVQDLAKWASAAAYAPEEAPSDTAYGKKSGKVAKGGGSLWPSFGSAFAAVDIARDDDGLPERVPERRGVSKAAKGQLDQGDDRHSENLWPSLS